MFSSAAQDHDIKGKTTTFEAEHKECIRVLPYTNASGQVYVQLYVFCDKNGIPEELKEAAQEFFGETGVELRWTNLYNYASNIPNIVSKDFKQLEVSQANVISKIINKNLPVFSKHRNITAIQPSLKVTNSKQTNHPCIRVYVLGKGCIPFGESEIPNAIENYPVDIADGFWMETSDTPKPLTAHKQEKYLRLGASIGVRGTENAGTLGAIVKDDSRFYLFSCDHVINHKLEREIVHPGEYHYLTSLKYHLIDYQNWIDRIIKPENHLKHDDLMPIRIFEHLQNQVDSFYNAPDVPRHPKLVECERKLDELFSKKPRTVAHYIGGIRKDAIAELTDKEVEALKENCLVEIIDTTNYPDGNVTMDFSQSNEKEWCKSGSTTGYTFLKSSFYFKNTFLSCGGGERWLKSCLHLPHNQNLFSYSGDSGAVIFEKSEQQPQAMKGFGILFGSFFSKDMGAGTLAIPLLAALCLLSQKLDRDLTLVSTL